jgi:hypothetical protein
MRDARKGGKMANTENLKSKWGELRKQIKPRWMSLSEDDIESIDGNEDVLVELLREKYGYNEAQARSQVETFLEENESANVSKPM